MKKVLKVVLYFVIGIIAFFALYLLADVVLSRISTSSKVEQAQLPKRYDLYVLSNGVHTDIVFPVKSDIIDWSDVFPVANTKGKDFASKYVAIGWGDKGFYLNTPEWKDLKAKTALVAASGIGETALHVTYYHTMRESELCYKVSIDSVQFSNLVAYVRSSYDQDDLGNPILIETTAQYGDSDAFYEAKGSYSLFFSCNTWTNKALKAANMPAAVWTVLDKGILRHYKK